PAWAEPECEREAGQAITGEPSWQNRTPIFHIGFFTLVILPPWQLPEPFEITHWHLPSECGAHGLGEHPNHQHQQRHRGGTNHGPSFSTDRAVWFEGASRVSFGGARVYTSWRKTAFTH